jgi:hypothetical protein
MEEADDVHESQRKILHGNWYHQVDGQRHEILRLLSVQIWWLQTVKYYTTAWHYQTVVSMGPGYKLESVVDTKNECSYLPLHLIPLA